MNPIFAQGGQVRVRATFQTVDSGAPLDPTDVYFTYSNIATVDLSGVTVPVTLHYGVDAALVREGVGIYHVDSDTTTVTSNWVWRFYATGTGAASANGVFYVRPTA